MLVSAKAVMGHMTEGLPINTPKMMLNRLEPVGYHTREVRRKDANPDKGIHGVHLKVCEYEIQSWGFSLSNCGKYIFGCWARWVEGTRFGRFGEALGVVVADGGMKGWE